MSTENAQGASSAGQTAGATGAASGGNCPAPTAPPAVPNRTAFATQLRIWVAQVSAGLPQAVSRANGEEGAYPPATQYQANHTKALPKQNNGRNDVVVADYQTYLRVLTNAFAGLPADFSTIPIGGIRKLTNPQAGLAFDLEGPDPSAVNLNLFLTPAESLRPAPRIDGKALGGGADPENAAEMIELYWMALTRDVHFADYTNDPSAGDTAADVAANWPNVNLVREAAADLSRPQVRDAFKERYPRDGAGNVTPATLFRGSAPGDAEGPYVSQFLLRGNTFLNTDPADRFVFHPENGYILHGTQPINLRQVTVVPDRDYLRDVASYRAVQEGTKDPTGRDRYDTQDLRYIRTMRDLGNWVHLDYVYQHFLNAALLMLNEPPLQAGPGGPAPLMAQRPLDNLAPAGPAGAPMRVFPFDEGLPYAPGKPDAQNQIGFVTFGPIHILTLVGEVAERAGKAAWFQKWYVHRRLRPEEFGGLVHFQKAAEDGGTPRANGPYPCIDPLILDAPVLQFIRERNKKPNAALASGEGAGSGDTYLLPQQFPEGSPTHPAYPAAHATIAGACATILKAFFKEDEPMTDATNTVPTDPTKRPPAFEVSADGLSVVKAADQGANGRLLVGHELNKLASNISLGRDGAGVHWRSDSTQGMELGEAVAAGLLFEQAFLFREPHSLSFTTFFTNERVEIARERRSTGDFIVVRIEPAGTSRAALSRAKPVFEQAVSQAAGQTP